MKKVNVTAVIGRFQPPHVYHIDELIGPALRSGDVTDVLLGSSLTARNPKNPLTWEMRADLITASVIEYFDNNDLRLDTEDVAGKVKIKNLLFVPIRDYLYSDTQWVVQVQHKLNEAVKEHFKYAVDYKVTLWGCEKDDSSYYLNLFPQWEHNFVVKNEGRGISGSVIREQMFEGFLDWATYVYPSARRILHAWANSEDARAMTEEYTFFQNYKKSWESAPYPVIFTTVDNVVYYKGNILLIKRKARPGKGLWALPGGFVEQGERLLDSAIRECREETNLLLKPEWCKGESVFDAPDRSLRGRTISYGYMWHIPDRLEISGVKGGDDASKAKWFPLGTVLEDMQDKLFEDHLDIVSQLIKFL